jgi:hypothetical protein
VTDTSKCTSPFLPGIIMSDKFPFKKHGVGTLKARGIIWHDVPFCPRSYRTRDLAFKHSEKCPLPI